MNFKLTATGTEKWIKVIDLLDKNKGESSQQARLDVPTEWTVKSSGADINAGFVSIAVAYSQRGPYNTHLSELDVYEDDNLPIDDSHLPRREGAKEDRVESAA